MEISRVLADFDGANFEGVVSGTRDPGRVDEDELRPTLVLGVGGAGHCVANQFKRILQEVTDHREPAHVRVLALDTSGERPKNAVLTSQEMIYISPPDITDYLRYKDDSTNTDVAEWVATDEQDIINYLTATGEAPTPGAGGTRQFGRLCLYHSMDKIQTKLMDAVEKTLDAAVQRGSAANLFVVASAGGGTGTGTLIDLLFLIREQVREYREARDKSRHELPVFIRTGIIMGNALAIRSGRADARLRSQSRANTYALLKELDAIVSGDLRFTARYPNGPRISAITSDVRLRADDRILANQYFLFDSRRDVSGWDKPDNNEVEDWDSYTDEIAAGMMHLSIEPFARDCESKVEGNPGKGHFRENNPEEELGRKQKQRGLYSSYGLTEVHVQGEAILRQMSRRLGIQAVDLLTEPVDVPSGEAWDVLWRWLCASFPADNRGDAKGIRGTESALDQIVREADLISTSGEDRLKVVSKAIARRYRKAISGKYKKNERLLSNATENLSEYVRSAETELVQWLAELRIDDEKRVFSSPRSDSESEDVGIAMGVLYAALNARIASHGLPHTNVIVGRLGALCDKAEDRLRDECEQGGARAQLRNLEFRDAMGEDCKSLPRRTLLDRLSLRKTDPNLEKRINRDIKKWDSQKKAGLRAVEDVATSMLALKIVGLIRQELKVFAQLELEDLGSLLSSTAEVLRRDIEAASFGGSHPAAHRRIRGLDSDDVDRMFRALVSKEDSANLAEGIAEMFRGAEGLIGKSGFEDVAQEYQRQRDRRDDICQEMADALVGLAEDAIKSKAAPNPDGLFQKQYLTALRARESQGELGFGELIELGNPAFLSNEAVLSRGNSDELYDRVREDLKLSMPAISLRVGDSDAGGWSSRTVLFARTGFHEHARGDDPHKSTSALWKETDGDGLGPHMGPVPDDLFLAEHPQAIMQFRQVYRVPLFLIRNLPKYREAYDKHRDGNLELLHIRREYARDLPEITMNSAEWVPTSEKRPAP